MQPASHMVVSSQHLITASEHTLALALALGCASHDVAFAVLAALVGGVFANDRAILSRSVTDSLMTSRESSEASQVATDARMPEQCAASANDRALFMLA